MVDLLPKLLTFLTKDLVTGFHGTAFRLDGLYLRIQQFTLYSDGVQDDLFESVIFDADIFAICVRSIPVHSAKPVFIRCLSFAEAVSTATAHKKRSKGVI